MHEILPWQRLPVPGSSGDCVKANSATFMQLFVGVFSGEMDRNGFQVAAMAAAAVPERHGRSLAGSQAWLMGVKSLKIIMILWYSQKTINHYIHLYLTYSSYIYIYIYVDQL